MTNKFSLSKQTPSPDHKPVRRVVLHWEEMKVHYGTLITPTARQIIRDKAAQFGISQADLWEYLSRSLTDSAIEQAILRQLNG